MGSVSRSAWLAAICLWLAKAHAYPFCVLRSTFKAMSDDGLEDWKALVFISVAMGFVALTATSIASIGFQHRVLLSDDKSTFMKLWGTVGLCLLAFNYYTLVSGRQWSRFEREFQHRSKATRLTGAILVWLSLILILVATEWSGSIAWKLPSL